MIPGITVTKAIELGQLAVEVGIPALGISTDTDGSKVLHTYDGQGTPADFASGVKASVVAAIAAHVPPPDDTTVRNTLAAKLIKARQDTAAATTVPLIKAALLDFEDTVLLILKRLGQKVS